MTRVFVAALYIAAGPALAFEGVLDTKLSMTGEVALTGTGTVTIKGLNFRMDQETKYPGGVSKMTSIAPADQPGVTYLLDDQHKTFQKLNTKDEPDSGGNWTVKRLGKETIAGRTTEHAQVQRDNKSEAMEVWIDTQLVSASDLAKALARSGGGGWWKALEKAGLSGVPLKFVSRGKDGKEQATWEATRVTAKSVPNSAFQIPAGFTETKSAGGMGSVPPAQQQELRDQMQKAMEKMTPEQRKQVEEMMKQGQGGQ